jgi:hypothetical protein
MFFKNKKETQEKTQEESELDKQMEHLQSAAGHTIAAYNNFKKSRFVDLLKKDKK